MHDDRLSAEVPRGEWSRLHLHSIASEVNQEYLNKLLSFIHDEFGMFPRESPEQLICYRPQFVAFVAANKTKSGLSISLFGEHFTSAKVRKGKFPNWRAFDVTHTDQLDDAMNLIREAHVNRIEADARPKTKQDKLFAELQAFLDHPNTRS